MNRRLAIAVLLGAVAAAAAALPQPDVDAATTCAERRELDFWLGDWQVRNAGGELVGTSRIGRRLGGCLIEESWSSQSGSSGASVTYYDPSVGIWRQHWVDARGGLAHYEGRYRDGAMRWVGESVHPDGRVVLARATLQPQPGGGLRHLIEHSSDGGGSWVAHFDGRYERAAASAAAPAAGDDAASRQSSAAAAAGPGAARPPAAPSAPQPAAEPAPRHIPAPARGSILPRTEVSPSGPIAAADEPQIQMASPMTLEFQIGAIHSLPERQAWFTEDVAAYVSNGVTVRRAELARRERPDEVLVDLTLYLHCARMRARIDLELELLSDGGVVAGERLDGVAVGRLVNTRDADRGVPVRATLELSAAAFRELFRDARRPSLRITVHTP